MSTALAQKSDKMLALLSTGDMKQLSPEERLAYFKARCEHAGLDPLSAPFEWMTLQGKLTLYAKKTATDQLAALHKLKVTIVSDKVIADAVYVVRARAEAPDGRVKEEDGAVPIKGLDPVSLANAVMKASTKAARRCVLSITGLSMLDESEMDTIADARQVETKPHVQALPTPPKVEVVEAGPLSPGIDPPAMTRPPPAATPEVTKLVMARVNGLIAKKLCTSQTFLGAATRILKRPITGLSQLSLDEMTRLEAAMQPVDDDLRQPVQVEDYQDEGDVA